MNVLLRHIKTLYSKFLHLYPRGFKEEFAEEMQGVFNDSVNAAGGDGILSLALICLRELGGLPFNILREFWFEFKRKEMHMSTSETMHSEASNGNGQSLSGALIGTLPFLLFGVASMIDKSEPPFHSAYGYLIFFAIMLAGLLIGMIILFPRWAYSYLGWSLVSAWWWSSTGTYGLRIFGFRIDYWTWQIPVALLGVIGIALIRTRSLHPLRQLARGIWQDWTHASFMMYTFVAFTGFVFYDENHHPYLIAFMIASTLAISVGAWFFLHEQTARKRIVALLSGFIAVAIIGAISEATWDWPAYYGLPFQPPITWYVSASRIILLFTFWGVILFWPALIGIVRRAINKKTMV